MEKSKKMTKDEIRQGGYRILFCSLSHICGRHEARVITRRLLKQGLTPLVSVKIGVGFDSFYGETWDDIISVDPKIFASRTGDEKKEKYSWLSEERAKSFKDLKWSLERKKIGLRLRRPVRRPKK